ncbi:hypothetical protein WDZ92_38855, partial [Nostoc sp. NIES-2111]
MRVNALRGGLADGPLVRAQLADATAALALALAEGSEDPEIVMLAHEAAFAELLVRRCRAALWRRCEELFGASPDGAVAEPECGSTATSDSEEEIKRRCVRSRDCPGHREHGADARLETLLRYDARAKRLRRSTFRQLALALADRRTMQGDATTNTVTDDRLGGERPADPFDRTKPMGHPRECTLLAGAAYRNAHPVPRYGAERW